MPWTYLISFEGRSIPLFVVDFEFKSEEPAIIDFSFRIMERRDLYSEDIIRMLYANLTGRYNHVSDPIDLLGILLANGYSMVRQQDGYVTTLAKDFFSVSFEVRSNTKTIKLGNYFRTSTSSADEQFILFCTWMDKHTGVSGMTRLMIYQFISAGYSLIAAEPNRTCVLVDVSASGQPMDGTENTLKYLADN